MLAEKEQLLGEVQAKIDLDAGFILASYKNLKGNKAAEFRQEMVKCGGTFFAFKKRVFIKAAEKLGLQFELSELEGHVGILLAEEESFLPLTKALVKFQDGNADTLNILAGHFKGRKCSSEEVKAISSLPGLDEMRAQMLGLFEAPLSQTLAVMNALLSSVIYCIDNKVKSET